MRGEFTGRHMAAILIAGFGVVIAVNLLMATLAIRGFGGVVVENSYVASQEFNGWLEAAKQSEALDYEATVERNAGGRLVINTSGVPDNARMSAQIRRPLGKPETQDILFEPIGNGGAISAGPVAPGRWIIRLTIEHGDARWMRESTIS